MELAGITRTVGDLENSRRFYEEVLGFERESFYATTHWQSYKIQEGLFFAIGEEPGSTNEVSFAVSNVEALWLRVKDKVDVVDPLEKTAWGTYRFVIKDPDGNLLTFGQK